MQLTTNTRAFIEAEQYSSFILMNLHDGLLPETFYRNVSDFQSGTTLNIKTVGSVTLQEAAENTPLDYNPIETGEVTLAMTDYEGDAWYVTDDLREDGTDIPMLMAQRSAESTRAYQESWETRFLATANAGQVDSDANLVNGFPHRISSTETNNVFAISQLVAMKLAFNKANVPDAGRVFICDSTVEATLSNLINITTDITPFGVDVLKSGLGRGMRMSMSLHGFDVIFSNRLPTGTFSDGTTQITNAVANIAMCILDDQCKPVMGVHRRLPRVEGERNKDLSRDEFVSKARYGLGVQRTDTLGVIITSAVNY